MPATRQSASIRVDSSHAAAQSEITEKLEHKRPFAWTPAIIASDEDEDIDEFEEDDFDDDFDDDFEEDFDDEFDDDLEDDEADDEPLEGDDDTEFAPGEPEDED
jgi:hypothetical protein